MIIKRQSIKKMPFRGFTKFSHIEERFDELNNWHIETHKPFTLWFVNPENSLRQWVNGTNDDGFVVGIESYTELKEKIQNKLRQMGYSDVSEIPQNIRITYE
jgi:hypothetical protein